MALADLRRSSAADSGNDYITDCLRYVESFRKQRLPARRAHSRAPRASDATSTRPTRLRFPRVPRKSMFGLLGSNSILIFFIFLNMNSISSINHHFLAPKPLKTLKSSPDGQELPGDSLRDRSDHQGPVSAQCYPPSCLFLTLS